LVQSSKFSIPHSSLSLRLTLDFSTINNFYDGPAHDDEVYAFSEPIRAELAAVSGFDNLTTYINYAFGDEGPNVWYGESNLPRLVATKQKWDPDYKFGPGNPIPRSL
jgi:hypothetical protein